MTKSVDNFVRAIKEGRITVDARPNANYNEMAELMFRYRGGKSLYDKAMMNMPEQWGYAEFPGTNACLVFRNNGFSTEFASYAPDRMSGGICLGEITLVDGTKLDATGCWSSRPGIYYKMVGDPLASIFCDGREFYIDVAAATQIADALGLVIKECMYTVNKDDGEKAYAFYFDGPMKGYVYDPNVINF